MDADKYLQQRNRKKRAKRVVICVLIALLASVIGISCSIAKIYPGIEDYCAAQLRSLATLAINDAVLYSLSDAMTYSDLVTVEKDAQGKIVMVSFNSLLINTAARKVEKNCEINLASLQEDGLAIPIGNLTTWPIFAGSGPTLYLNVSSHEAVKCEFVSVFEQAGINQTLHKIYININAVVALLMPTYSTDINLTTQVLIAENILIGDVPTALINT